MVRVSVGDMSIANYIFFFYGPTSYTDYFIYDQIGVYNVRTLSKYIPIVACVIWSI